MGKSTLLQQENPDLTIDLLAPELQLAYNKTPNLLSQQIDDLPPGNRCKILIDEIQRVPKLLDIVHAFMEKRSGLQFMMCGSSAGKLRHGASNLLGGRALYRTMHPLTVNKLSSDFNLQRALSYGSLRKIHSRSTPTRMIFSPRPPENETKPPRSNAGHILVADLKALGPYSCSGHSAVMPTARAAARRDEHIAFERGYFLMDLLHIKT